MLERGKNERGVIEMVGTESLVPADHLFRQIDVAVDFGKLYEIVEPLYSIDPVVLFKIVLLQHLDGNVSLRGTLRRAQTDVAYRWFLGYTLSEELPHFSTVSYNFRHRFTEGTIEAVFHWILEEAGSAGALTPAAVFIECRRRRNGIGMSCWQRSTQTGKPMGKSPSTMTILLRPPKRSGTTPRKRSWPGGKRRASKP